MNQNEGKIMELAWAKNFISRVRWECWRFGVRMPRSRVTAYCAGAFGIPGLNQAIGSVQAFDGA